MKATTAQAAKQLTDIPNIGPAMARDLRALGVTEPKDLKGKDALTLYRQLSKLTGQRQDPCVLDTFLAAIDFMNDAPARPWWWYTTARKRLYPYL